MRCVVDASVAIKWYLPEEYREAAARLLNGTYELVGPDLLLSECTNVLWKQHRKGSLSQDEARAILSDLLRQPLDLRSSTPLLAAALELATHHNRTVYDSLYVALALREGCRFVTADRRLFNALSNPLGATLLWVEDIPAA